MEVYKSPPRAENGPNQSLENVYIPSQITRHRQTSPNPQQHVPIPPWARGEQGLSDEAVVLEKTWWYTGEHVHSV